MSPSSQQPKRSFLQMKSRVFDQFLDTELSELTRVKRWVHSSVKIAVMVGRDFFQNWVKL
jgi:hypothetical protein